MIVRVHVQSRAIKGKDAGIGRQVALALLLPKNLSQQQPLLMSADHNTPLFEISDGDDAMYEDDPAIIQARANLAAAEHVQQERAEQKRLEREEQRAQAEAERLKGEIEEVEKRRRELEEVEVRRLAQEKDRLEVEKQIEEQHGVQLRRAEEGSVGGTIASQSWPK